MSGPITDQNAATPREEPAPQRMVGERYQLRDQLGVGGMGAVYRAEHVLMRKTVALKVLHPELAGDDSAVARFHLEAQAAANIAHPNVCTATDFGQADDGSLYLVYEYLHGRTLRQALAEDGAMAPGRALHVLQQLADGLAAAHGRGVVHRDLKPDNVMLLERDGDPDFVKIMDFGIARVRLGEGADDDDTRITTTGMVCGTPAYMAPEQAAGDDVDARADLYSLGVIAFELLTGRLPFEAETSARLMAMHVTVPPPSLSEAAGRPFAAELETLVAQMLEKMPERRLQTAGDVRDQVRRIQPTMVGMPATLATTVSAPPAFDSTPPASDAPPRAKEASRRRPRWLAPLAGGTGLGLVVLVAALAMSGPTEDARPEIGRSRAELREAAARRPEVSAVNAIRKDSARLVAAATLLEDLDGEPAVYAALGAAALEDKRCKEGLTHWGNALDADPEWAFDPAFRKGFAECYTSRGPAHRKVAEAFFRERDVGTLNGVMAEIGTLDGSIYVRQRARELLDETGRTERLEDWQKLSVALRKAKNCKDRKALIADLVDLNDRRVVPLLEAYSSSRPSCGPLGTRDCYACIRDDLAKALKALGATP